MGSSFPRVAVPYRIVPDGRDWSLRTTKELPATGRTPFERDRDRILYSRAFRRLSGKTQIFYSSAGDHIRTRLTHTLEVAQIASSIARRLRLDQFLTEAIAYGHDLGHTPFGHVGERVLNRLMNGCYDVSRPLDEELRRSSGPLGFKHNLQGVSVVQDHLQLYGGFDGLNLTRFTMWGIANHSSTQWKPCGFLVESSGDSKLQSTSGKCHRPEAGHLSVGYYDKHHPCLNLCPKSNCDGACQSDAWSMEAFAVKAADEIAQRHHDVEDGLLGGALTHGDVIDRLTSYFRSSSSSAEKRMLSAVEDARGKDVFAPCVSRFLVNTLEGRLVESVKANVAGLMPPSRRGFVAAYNTSVFAREGELAFRYDQPTREADENLRGWVKNAVLNSFAVQRMDGMASHVIRKLFKAYITNPQQLPDRTVWHLVRNYRRAEGAKAPDKYKAELRDDIDGLLRSNDVVFPMVLARTITNHIACMTDSYALQEFRQLYGHSAPTDHMRAFGGLG